MSKLIVFSTGNYHTENGFTVDKAVKLCRDLPIDGVEITYLDDIEMLNERLSPESVEILRGFSHNTIHAPIRNKTTEPGESLRFAYKRDDSSTAKVLGKLYYIAGLIGAKNINFHYYNVIDPTVFSEDISLTIENTILKKGSIDIFKRKLDELERFNFLLDVTHAKNEVQKYIDLIGAKNIKYVHLSHYDESKDKKTHRFMHTADDETLKKIKPIKSLDAVIVIESHLLTADVKLMKKEIEFVRGWLG